MTFLRTDRQYIDVHQTIRTTQQRQTQNTTRNDRNRPEYRERETAKGTHHAGGNPGQGSEEVGGRGRRHRGLAVVLGEAGVVGVAHFVFHGGRPGAQARLERQTG